MGYYRQREWRILANAIWHGVPITRELTDNEKTAVLAIDAAFFGCEKDFRTGRYRVVDQCQVMLELGGRHVLAYAERLLVPLGPAGEAERILAEADIELPVTEFALDYPGSPR
jgi:hypothetical protein